MKLTISQEKLKNGINIVERIAIKSLNLPILNNILISVQKSFLNLTTTDLEIGINWWALVKTEKEGNIVIPSKILSNFINLLPNKPIKLEAQNLTLKVECENRQTSIKGLDSGEFPIIPKINKDDFVSIKSKLFCENLNQIVDVVSSSSTKPEISGIYFLFQKNLITMVATDTFRLGEKKLSLNPPATNLVKDYSLILPQRAAKEVISVFGEKEGDLKIYFSPNQVLFETALPETDHPEIQLISRIIEGEYPSYQEIIPKKHETTAIFQRNELINQVKTASLFSGKISEIKLKIDPKQKRADIFSQNPEVGDYQGFLVGKIEGKPCEISFNYRFLIDGLLNIKSPEVVLELTNSEKPGVLKPKGDDSYLYLVMPIKAS